MKTWHDLRRALRCPPFAQNSSLAIAATLLLTFMLTLVLLCEPWHAGSAIPRVTLLDAFLLDLRRDRVFAWLVVSRSLFLLGTYVVGFYLQTGRLGVPLLGVLPLCRMQFAMLWRSSSPTRWAAWQAISAR